MDERTRADIALEGFLSRYDNRLTIQSYTIALKQWFAWCADSDLDPLDAKRVDIEKFARALNAVVACVARALALVVPSGNVNTEHARRLASPPLIDPRRRSTSTQP